MTGEVLVSIEFLQHHHSVLQAVVVGLVDVLLQKLELEGLGIVPGANTIPV